MTRVARQRRTQIQQHLLNRFAGGPRPLLSDLFNEAVNTSLPSHTPDIIVTGASWTIEPAGTWTVTAATDQLDTSLNAAGNSVAIDVGETDIDVQADLITSSTAGASGMGLTARFVDNANFILAWLNHSVDLIFIYQRTGGFNVLASRAYALAESTVYTVRLTIDSAHLITMYVNGVQQLQVTDSAHDGATEVGFHCGSDQPSADNMSCYEFGYRP